MHRLRDWVTALDFYEELRRENLQPTDAMASHLLGAVGRSGKLDRLVKVTFCAETNSR